MKKVILIPIIVLVVLFSGLVWNVSMFLIPSGNQTGEVIVDVPPGKGFSQVSEDLFRKKLITSVFHFKVLAHLLQYTRKIMVGEYAIDRGTDPISILKVLASGKSIHHPVTFQEGLNIYEMSKFLMRENIVSGDEFLYLAKNKKFIVELLGEPFPTLEGYLFPETYQLTKYSTAKELIESMVAQFKAVYKEVAKHMEVDLTPHEVVTLASIIEKETGAPSERPKISSVFHNRLAKSMRLQSDPTILYGLLEKSLVMKKNITKKDIESYTRYNTYRLDGLPFGPIANPGREALYASVTPIKSEFLFFVSRNDGTHKFSRTYEEHSRAVRKFQLDRKARKGKSWRDLKKKK